MTARIAERTAFPAACARLTRTDRHQAAEFYATRLALAGEPVAWVGVVAMQRRLARDRRAA